MTLEEKRSTFCVKIPINWEDSMGCGWKESFHFEGMHKAGSSLLGLSLGG